MKTIFAAALFLIGMSSGALAAECPLAEKALSPPDYSSKKIEKTIKAINIFFKFFQYYII